MPKIGKPIGMAAVGFRLDLSLGPTTNSIFGNQKPILAYSDRQNQQRIQEKIQLVALQIQIAGCPVVWQQLFKARLKCLAGIEKPIPNRGKRCRKKRWSYIPMFLVVRVQAEPATVAFR